MLRGIAGRRHTATDAGTAKASLYKRQFAQPGIVSTHDILFLQSQDYGEGEARG